MSTFRVDLTRTVNDSYDIEISANLFHRFMCDIRKGLVGNISNFVIITDDNVKELYANDLLNILTTNGYKADLISFAPGESNKTRQTKEYIEDTMFRMGYRRDCCIIAIGGGVVSDISGFVAGTYCRGIPYINYATTLLAAADASVGGKVAVDTSVATNLIGLFYQPKKVYIDISCFSTLDSTQIACGLAETIKHALIMDESFLSYLEANIEKVYSLDEEVCTLISKRNCNIKHDIVMKDEKESGLREILNLGHTVGRAIEALADGKLLHGQCVSIGIVAQAMISNRLGHCENDDVDRICRVLQQVHLPISIPEDIDRDELVRKLYTDKKVKAGKLRFVLLERIGEVLTAENTYAIQVDEALVREVLATM